MSRIRIPLSDFIGFAVAIALLAFASGWYVHALDSAAGVLR